MGERGRDSAQALPLASHGTCCNHLRVVFFACTGNYLQISMIVFLALLVFLAHNSPMPHKTAQGERIGGHLEFLQQARLGKRRAPAGGSGLEKIVGRSSQYCSAPGWDRQQEHQPATRNPPAGFNTAVRQTGMPRTEKPSAHALTGRKATAKT